MMPCLRKLSISASPPVGDALPDQFQKALVRDAVRAALDVHIHHMDEPASQQLLHAVKSILTTAPRTKSMAVLGKLAFEDRFNDHLHRGLHDAIGDRRDPNGLLSLLPGFGM